MGAHVVREFTQQRLTIVLVRVVLAVTVSVAHPRLTDAPRCRETHRERGNLNGFAWKTELRVNMQFFFF